MTVYRPKYNIKDKLIRIFAEDEDGIAKKYIHGKYDIHAYVRQLSANEQTSLDAVQDASDIEFVINYRKLIVDMYVEFGDKVYQITGIDNFEFLPIETKFRAKEVNKKQYKKVYWS